MNAIAGVLDEALNNPREFGFALLVFRFSEPESDNDERHRMNYISNAGREEMLTAMKEFIARNEGRYDEGAKPFDPTKKQ